MPTTSHSHTNVEITMLNPAGCLPHTCRSHAETGHTHGPGCGHTAVRHGDHIDYCVGDHLHHPHDGHCDDHGPVEHKA
jgi:hypothetical protein